MPLKTGQWNMKAVSTNILPDECLITKSLEPKHAKKKIQILLLSPSYNKSGTQRMV